MGPKLAVVIEMGREGLPPGLVPIAAERVGFLKRSEY